MNTCGPWREQIVGRSVRSLGVEERAVAAPNGETEQLAQIKAIELAAERLQNQLLAECLPLRHPERTLLIRRSCVRSSRVVCFFSKTHGKPIASFCRR